MTEVIDTFNQTLRKAGFSCTQARRVVFEALQGQEPQTMHQLVTACDCKVDRASIYRTVALFEQLGIIQRLQIGWKYKLELSDAFTHHHHHLSCVVCGKITALPEDHALESRLKSLAKTLNFEAQDHQLEIRGLCQNCQTIN